MAFRMSEEENKQLDIAVKLTGLSKQSYIIKRLLNQDVVVYGNPRVHKALREQISEVLGELRRIDAGKGLDADLMDTINLIVKIWAGFATPQNNDT